jgi:SAM-dependent methyltransferase
MGDLPEHVRRNRTHWDQLAAKYASAGERSWANNAPRWGIWGVPESEVGMLPDDLAGKDVIELGCGTAYVSSWLARRGARVVGIDNSQQQLATARRLQREHGLDFPLIHGNAESVPYPDASFDFAISEYGACLWADPQRWVPEAARLLRPGGRLHFLANAFLLALCVPAEDDLAAGDRLLRPAFGMYRIEWPTYESVEFISRTATGSDCCGGPDSRSRTWSRSVLEQTRRRAIRTSRSSGRGSGHARKRGRCASVHDCNRLGNLIMAVEISVGPPVLTINQGSTFMVTELSGEIAANGEQGLFASDTRFVSYYAISANGDPWTPVTSGTPAPVYYGARIHLTNGDLITEDIPVARGTIALTISRGVAEGVHEGYILPLEHSCRRPACHNRNTTRWIKSTSSSNNR